VPAVHPYDTADLLPADKVHFSAYRPSQLGFPTPRSSSDPDEEPPALSGGLQLLATRDKSCTAVRDDLLHGRAERYSERLHRRRPRDLVEAEVDISLGRFVIQKSPKAAAEKEKEARALEQSTIATSYDAGWRNGTVELI
jgi:hypothetical protein